MSWSICLDENADLFVEILEAEGEVAEPGAISRSEGPAPSHQHKPGDSWRRRDKMRVHVMLHDMLWVLNSFITKSY